MKILAKLKIWECVVLPSAIRIAINNGDVFINGELLLPSGTSDFQVTGEISAEQIALSGSQMTPIDIGNGAMLETNLSVEIFVNQVVKSLNRIG